MYMCFFWGVFVLLYVFYVTMYWYVCFVLQMVNVSIIKFNNFFKKFNFGVVEMFTDLYMCVEG